MDDVARVVLALEEHDVVEEVMHFLDRTGRARVVGTATDDRQLVEAIRQLEPDAIVAQPSLVDGTVRGRPWFAVETRESVASLRVAIAAGARGFFLWPGEREALAGATAATLARIDVVERRAKVFGIHASRGGAGATFVVTHLARAFARRGSSVILIDADPVFADVGVALGAAGDGAAGDDATGAPEDDGPSRRTLGDLLPLGGEIGPRQLEQVLWEHPEAFRVLLAPPPEDAARVDASDLEGAVRAAAADADVVLVLLPRALGGSAAGLVGSVDRLVEVLTLDVLAFRAATRVLHGLHPAAAGDRVAFVVNRAARGEIVPSDVERVFGRAAIAVIPFDRAVAKAQDHGRLLPPRGRIARICDRLAASLEQEEAS